MRTRKSKRKPKKKPANLEKLIELEWDIIKDLKKMLLPSSELSAAEKIRAANALAYHASVLNKLLTQRGESAQFNDKSLGDFIRGVEPRIARRVRRDFKTWTRKLSLRR